jgi:pimeloyl-ACP methyl ester carboxylesterase
MKTTQSADATVIAYETVGNGDAVVVVPGPNGDHTGFAVLADLLASRFTVVTYDRRGRGESSDTPPYSVTREVEDLAAVIHAAGGSAGVFGHSSGAILALEAAAAGLPITKLAVYEPPYVDRFTPGLTEEVQSLGTSGQRDEALVAFMLNTGMPPDLVPAIKQSPAWDEMLAIADTLWHDLKITGDAKTPVARLATIDQPTLVLDGSDSPAELRTGAQQVADAVHDARHITCEGQNHAVAQAVLAPILAHFFE